MKKLVLLFICLIFLTGCLVIETDQFSRHSVLLSREPKEDVAPAQTQTEPLPVATTEPPVTITLGALGDILASSENMSSAKSGSVYEFSGHFKLLKPTIQKQDYTLASLISPISGGEFGYTGYPFYNAPQEFGQALRDLGIDALNTSNSNALDLGNKALQMNLTNLKNLGFFTYGTNASEEDAKAPSIVDIQGIKLGLLSYTEKLNQLSPNDYTISRLDQLKMAEDIEALRTAGADIICVNLYWGSEYADQPSEQQMNLMNYLETLGVDIVLGGSPKVIQPMSIKTIDYAGREKKIVQAYSLGNLYSGFLMNRAKTGLMIEMDIKKENGVAEISEVRSSLIYNHQSPRMGNQIDYQLVNLDQVDDFYEDSQYQEMLDEKSRVTELLELFSKTE